METLVLTAAIIAGCVSVGGIMITFIGIASGKVRV